MVKGIELLTKVPIQSMNKIFFSKTLSNQTNPICIGSKVFEKLEGWLAQISDITNPSDQKIL